MNHKGILPKIIGVKLHHLKQFSQITDTVSQITGTFSYFSLYTPITEKTTKNPLKPLDFKGFLIKMLR